MLLTFPCSVACLKWTSPAAVHQKCRTRVSTNVAIACLPSSNMADIQLKCLYTLITPLPGYLPLFSTSLPSFPPPRYVWSLLSWLLCSEMCGNSSLASTLPYVSAPLNTTNAHACCACGCPVLSSCLCALVWTHAHNCMSSTDLQLCPHIQSTWCTLKVSQQCELLPWLQHLHGCTPTKMWRNPAGKLSASPQSPQCLLLQRTFLPEQNDISCRPSSALSLFPCQTCSKVEKFACLNTRTTMYNLDSPF